MIRLRPLVITSSITAIAACASVTDIDPAAESIEQALVTLRPDGRWTRVGVRARETRRLTVGLEAGAYTLTWTDHQGHRPDARRPRCELDVRALDEGGREILPLSYNTSRDANGTRPDPRTFTLLRRTTLRIEMREVSGYGDDVDVAIAAVEATRSPPDGLVVHRAGSVVSDATPLARRAIGLAGGGPDHEAAMRALLAAAGNGDVVVLRMDDTGGGYARWLVALGASSVHELAFDARPPSTVPSDDALARVRLRADAPWVEEIVDRAEMVFFAGGDQTKYVDAWKNTALARAVSRAAARGVVGGTSAGMHVLGGVVHTPRGPGDSVTSTLALADPYIDEGEHAGTASLSFSPSPFVVAPISDFVMDTHWSERRRLGRSLVFLARVIEDGIRARSALRMVACDEGVVLVIDEHLRGRVFAPAAGGAAWLLTPDTRPDTCSDGRALEWTGGVSMTRVAGSTHGDLTFDFAAFGAGAGERRVVTVRRGVVRTSE